MRNPAARLQLLTTDDPHATAEATIERPNPVSAVEDGRIEPREYLTMSVMFDHDAADGADAPRFIARLRKLLKES